MEVQHAIQNDEGHGARPILVALTVLEFAKLCERSTPWVRKIERAGEIRAIKIGRGERLFPVAEVRRFLLARAAKDELRRERRSDRRLKSVPKT